MGGSDNASITANINESVLFPCARVGGTRETDSRQVWERESDSYIESGDSYIESDEGIV